MADFDKERVNHPTIEDWKSVKLLKIQENLKLIKNVTDDLLTNHPIRIVPDEINGRCQIIYNYQTNEQRTLNKNCQIILTAEFNAIEFVIFGKRHPLMDNQKNTKIWISKEPELRNLLKGYCKELYGLTF